MLSLFQPNRKRPRPSTPEYEVYPYQAEEEAGLPDFSVGVITQTTQTQPSLPSAFLALTPDSSPEIVGDQESPIVSDIPMASVGPVNPNAGRVPETLRYKDFLRQIKQSSLEKYAAYKALKANKDNNALQEFLGENLRGITYAHLKGYPKVHAKFLWFCLRKIWKTTVLSVPNLRQLYLLKCKVSRRRKFRRASRVTRKFSRRKFRRTYSRFRRYRRKYRSYRPRRRFSRRRY